MGAVSVPEDRLWGAGTQRSLENFQIGEDKMPLELVFAIALIKKCCARASEELQLLDPLKSRLIQAAAEEVRRGLWSDHFPLSVWQTGSGTQTNMNVNEVIARRAMQLAAKEAKEAKGAEEAEGLKAAIHPNDDVNKCQSSNDVFPSAMRISLSLEAGIRLLPALRAFESELGRKSKDFRDIVKIGRTHLMDAVPLTLGQEFSAFQEQIRLGGERVRAALPHLLALPIGGTAVGTGLNTAPGFAQKACSLIAEEAKSRLREAKAPEEFAAFRPAENKMEAIASHDSLIHFGGALRSLAISLMKIANDIRLLASGPRCGLGELILPANEPGSSIMPGKVNPTQCEALSMVSAQAIGQDLGASFGGAMGHLQLNAFKPLIIFNLLRSVRLLSDGMNSFRKKCLSGIRANKGKIQAHLQNSLMLAAALNPHIGYEKAARAAQAAHKNGTSLKEETVRLGFLSAEEFDQAIQPKKMTSPNLP